MGDHAFLLYRPLIQSAPLIWDPPMVAQVYSDEARRSLEAKGFVILQSYPVAQGGIPFMEGAQGFIGRQTLRAGQGDEQAKEILSVLDGIANNEPVVTKPEAAVAQA